MTNPWIVLLITVGIIVLSTFFVILEFSVMGARRYRLEQHAETSRAARAALRNINELTVMLAGAQLGITACTFALGAVTKPAVHDWLHTAFEALNMPAWLTEGASFLLALLVVTFLHLVIGEMAPKSWTLAHPERAAMLTSLPARGYIWVFAPLLRWINRIANRLVAASGVEPVDRAAVGGQDAATIRRIVEHSADVGTLEQTIGTPISGAIDLEDLTVDDLISADAEVAQVSAEDTVADLQAVVLATQHKRILVRYGNETSPGIVHVRDTLLEPADRTVGGLARPAFVVHAGTSLHKGLHSMREAGEQLAVVMDDTTFRGIITFHDAVRRLLPPQNSVPE